MTTGTVSPIFRLWQGLIAGAALLCQWAGAVAAVAALLLTLVVGGVALSHYFFHRGSVAIQELGVYAFCLLAVLAIGYSIYADAQVRVDIFHRRFSSRQRRWVEVGGWWLALLPTITTLGWLCWPFVAIAWQRGEASPESGGLPWYYLLRCSLLLLVVVMTAASLAVWRRQPGAES